MWAVGCELWTASVAREQDLILKWPRQVLGWSAAALLAGGLNSRLGVRARIYAGLTCGLLA